VILITKKHLIETVAARFRFHNFYQKWHGEWKWNETAAGASTEDMYNKLLGLPKGSTEKRVIEIMGNSDYVDIVCVQCRQRGLEAAVSLCGCKEISQVGTCLNCLKKAVVLIEEEKK